MARKDRISMDRKAQIIELHKRGHSVRRIAQALKMCRKSIQKCIERENLTENHHVLHRQIDPKSILQQFPEWMQNSDWKYILNEIRKGISYKILYEESGIKEVSYCSFWRHFSHLNKALNPNAPKTTMRLLHKPGEKAFVDYGDGINIVNPATGEFQKTWVFVGTLPFSSKVYAEFVFDQKSASFIASHERMWKYFGGVTKYTVTDNLKSAVTRAHLYDPDLNKTFCAYANHAGFALLAARPRRPKDKANVECHVGILQDSFFQSVRNKQFFTLGELNESLRHFLLHLNSQIMKDYGISRNERFKAEVEHLQALPINNFEVPDIREATVHPDCHVQVCRSFYSVPWQYVGKKVRVVVTTDRVQIFDQFSLERIALHSHSKKFGERKTDELHWPPEKREHNDFTIERAKRDAKNIGEKTEDMMNFLFDLPHPLQYLRRVQGWLRSVSYGKYSRSAMEYASTMAMQHKIFRSRYINDCAEFYDCGGLSRPTKTGAPKRDSNLIHIHS